MKLGLFTDPHYYFQEVGRGGRCPIASLRKIREAMTCFQKEKCDMAICLGDLIDSDVSRRQEMENLLAVRQVLDSAGLPVIVLMGNHDAQVFTDGEFYGLLGEDRRPRDFTVEGKTFVFVDAGYLSSGEPYRPGNVVWNDSFCPFPEELAQRLEMADGDVYVFMHQIIVPGLSVNHEIRNAQQLRRIVEESGKVRRVYQGHYHRGHRGILKGVEYCIPKGMCLHENAYIIENV